MSRYCLKLLCFFSSFFLLVKNTVLSEPTDGQLSGVSLRPVGNKLGLEKFNEETMSEANSLVQSHLSWYQRIDRHNAYV